MFFKSLYLQILCFCLLACGTQAARVVDVITTQDASYGAFMVNNGVGSVKLNSTNSCSTSGDVAHFGGCKVGKITVTANRYKLNHWRRYGRTIKVFLTNNRAPLSRGSHSISQQLSLSPNTIQTSKQYNVPNVPGRQDVDYMVDIYGITSGVIPTQNPGDYSGSYNIVVCSCYYDQRPNCPTSTSDPRCTGF